MSVDVEEPKDQLGPAEWDLTTRIPVVVACSELHTSLRNLQPKLMRVPIVAGWPQWRGQFWTVDFSRALNFDDAGDLLARVFVWPNGDHQLLLQSDHGRVSTTTPLKPGKGMGETPMSAAVAAFDAIMTSDTLSLLADHLYAQVKDAPSEEDI